MILNLKSYESGGTLFHASQAQKWYHTLVTAFSILISFVQSSIIFKYQTSTYE